MSEQLTGSTVPGATLTVLGLDHADVLVALRRLFRGRRGLHLPAPVLLLLALLAAAGLIWLVWRSTLSQPVKVGVTAVLAVVVGLVMYGILGT